MVSRASEGPTDPGAAARLLARSIRQVILLARHFGWEMPLQEVPRSVPGAVAAARAGHHPPRAAPPAPQRSVQAVPAGIEAERARRRILLAPIEAEIRACRACVLCEKRKQAVPGVGDPCARLMFVGEGPGEDEDRRGEPFVGKAGQLLDRMILAMGLRRQDVYIANIVKCRPPGNRTPDPREIISCLPYLRRQVEIIRPEVICALGAVASRTVLDTTLPIGRLRGRFGEFQGIPVLPTFHPAYLLRNPADKRLAWEDLQKVMDRLGQLESPGSPTRE